MTNKETENNNPKIRKPRINPGIENGAQVEYRRVPQRPDSLPAASPAIRPGSPIVRSDSQAANPAAPVKRVNSAGSKSGSSVGRPELDGKPISLAAGTKSPSVKYSPPAVKSGPQTVRSVSGVNGGGASGSKSGSSAGKTSASKAKSTAAPKKTINTKILAALLVVVVLLPIIYFTGKTLGLFGGKPGHTTLPDIIDTTDEDNNSDLTGLDINSEEFLLAKELTSKEIIYPGVSLAGVSFANFTREQALEELERLNEELGEKSSFVLIVADNSIVATFADLDISLKIEEILQEMWSFGRQSLNDDENMQIMERYQEIIALEQQPVDLPHKYNYSEGKIETGLHALLDSVVKEPVNAKAVSFNKEKLTFNVEPEVVGVIVDYQDAVSQIKSFLDGDTQSKRIIVSAEQSYPDITAVELQKKVHLLAEATTPIMSQHSGRMSNLRRVDEMLSGTIIQPGETFSYMSSVGPVTEANGYVNASVLVSGEYVDGMGGGLCQPSTTLFQAAAKSGLTIIERRNHGLVGTYFKPGTDAMVSGWSDLKFRNDSKQPVVIMANTTSKNVTYKIYGNTKAANVTIKMTTEKIGSDVHPGSTVYIEDKTLAPGRVVRDNRAIVGTSWQTYLEYYQDGKLLKKEKLWRSTYKAKAETYRVAVGEIPEGHAGATTTIPTEETTSPTTLTPTTAATTKAAETTAATTAAATTEASVED